MYREEYLISSLKKIEQTVKRVIVRFQVQGDGLLVTSYECFSGV